MNGSCWCKALVKAKKHTWNNTLFLKPSDGLKHNTEHNKNILPSSLTPIPFCFGNDFPVEGSLTV